MYLELNIINRTAFSVVLFIYSLLFSIPVLSDSVEDGLHAFKQGDKELAYKNWLPLAIQGNVRAQFFLSALYEQWAGGSEDINNSKRWLTASANNGFIPAQFNLGNNFHLGKYSRANNKMAAYWWEQAAVQGFTEAQYLLGTLYYWGEGIELDLKESFYWFEKAANSGSQEARTAMMQARAGTLERDRNSPINIAYDDPRIVLGPSATTSIDNGQRTEKELIAGKPDSEVAAPRAQASDSKQTLGKKGSDTALDSVPATDMAENAVVVKDTPEQPRDQGLNWVHRQPADNYTIQIFASGRMKHCEKYVGQLRRSHKLETSSYPFVMQRRKMCAVVYGSYASRSEAMAKLSELPRKIRLAKPWVRKLGGLQRLAR